MTGYIEGALVKNEGIVHVGHISLWSMAHLTLKSCRTAIFSSPVAPPGIMTSTRHEAMTLFQHRRRLASCPDGLRFVPGKQWHEQYVTLLFPLRDVV